MLFGWWFVLFIFMYWVILCNMVFSYVVLLLSCVVLFGLGLV